MKNINSRIIFPSLTLLAGLVWVVMGLTQYGWWTDNKPGSGFFPSIVGIILFGISILAIVNEKKSEQPEYIRGHLYPLLAAVGIILAAMVIGFFPALVLFLFGWLKWFEKYSLKFALLTSGVTVLSLFGIFVLWLRVPFPMGIIYKALVG